MQGTFAASSFPLLTHLIPRAWKLALPLRHPYSLRGSYFESSAGRNGASRRRRVTAPRGEPTQLQMMYWSRYDATIMEYVPGRRATDFQNDTIVTFKLLLRHARQCSEIEKNPGIVCRRF